MSTIYVLIERDHDYDAGPDKVVAVSANIDALLAHKAEMEAIKGELQDIYTVYYKVHESFANRMPMFNFRDRPQITDRSKEGNRAHSQLCDQWFREHNTALELHAAAMLEYLHGVIRVFVEEITNSGKGHLLKYIDIGNGHLSFNTRIGSTVQLEILETPLL